MWTRWSKRGKASAFERDVMPLLDPLFGFAVYLSGNRAEAEDLVQDTLLKAYRSFDRFEPGTNLKAWLYTILTNTFRNRIRRRHDWVELDEGAGADLDGPFSSGAIGPEGAAIDASVGERVREAIDRLPPDFRAVVLLADLEGYAYREIADILGVPIGTVMSRLHRGRQGLKRMLGEVAREVVPLATMHEAKP